MQHALDTLNSYYHAFNHNDPAGMLALLTDDVVHDINQGERQTGKAAFAAFLQTMERCYKEYLHDLVIMANADGTRASAEFTVHGSYLQGDPGMPVAHGQRYILPAGAFFTLRNGKISRVTVYYNLADWLRQVGTAA